MMSPMSAEATVVRNYLDWVLALPWEDKTEDKLDIDEAEQILDRGPLRPAEGQGAHPRVPRRAGARDEAQGADPVPRRPAGRRQDLARAFDRARDRPQVRAPVARRRARRGRDPRPPPHLHRRAARQDHPVAQEGRDRRTRCSCSTRSTRCRSTSAATRRRRCSRCSTPSRTHVQRPLSRPRLRSVGGHVHHDGQLRCTRSRCRCRTAWRSSSCPATPNGRSSRSPAVPDPEAARGNGVKDVDVEFTDEGAPRRSSTTTRRKPACGTSSARSRRCCRKIAKDVARTAGKARGPDVRVIAAEASARVPRRRASSARRGARRKTRSASRTAWR